MRLIIALLLAISSVALADNKTTTLPPPPQQPPAPQEQAQDQDQLQEQDQEQAQDQEQEQTQTLTNNVRFDYPRISAVFGMGYAGYGAPPVSNGPCPIWVQDKPSRSFPGLGRGPTYVKDVECWEMTEKWLEVQLLELELERMRLSNDRLRMEAQRQAK